MPVKHKMYQFKTNLTCKTEVMREAAKANITFCSRAPGDFSAHTSEINRFNRETKKSRGFEGKNTSEVMKDMNTVSNLIIPDKFCSTQNQQLSPQLSIDQVNSSYQASIKQNPRLRKLIMLKLLLVELQTHIETKKELHDLLNRLYSDNENYENLKEEMKDFHSYQIDDNVPSQNKKDKKE